jgi:hypothetical protein
LRRRLPACQSSSAPTSSALTANAGSCGISRRLRFSSVKPGTRPSVIPQFGGVVVVWQPAENRAEERGAVRWLELQDRRVDILGGEGKGFVGLPLNLRVHGGVVQCVGQGDRQAGAGERFLGEGARLLRHVAGAAAGHVLERLLAQPRIERPDGLAPVLVPDPRGAAEQVQARTLALTAVFAGLAGQLGIVTWTGAI